MLGAGFHITIDFILAPGSPGPNPTSVAQAPQAQPQPVAPVQQQLPVAPVQQPSYARQVAVPKPVSPPVTPYNPNVLKTEISVDKTARLSTKMLYLFFEK